jgi:predicted phage tail protein
VTDVDEATIAAEDHSTGELLNELSEQLRRLARAEARLAVVELRRRGKRAGLGAAAFGMAMAAGLLGGGALVVCAIVALDLVLPLWLSALLVGVAVLLGAGLAALLGRSALRRALPPIPTWAAASVREDVRTIAKGAHR